MKIRYSGEAEKKLNSIDEEIEQRLREEIEKLEDGPTSHEKVKLIQVNQESLFRLKIGERNGKLDHRAIFDIQDSEIIILTVIHRDEGYHQL